MEDDPRENEMVSGNKPNRNEEPPRTTDRRMTVATAIYMPPAVQYAVKEMELARSAPLR